MGEEDESSISLDGLPPFRVGQLVAPPELEPLIVRLRDRMDSLSAGLTAKPEHKGQYEGLAAFIDPIDGTRSPTPRTRARARARALIPTPTLPAGTREFCTGAGDQCSICIGLADASSGAAVAGLVYRPLCGQRSWAMGCAREGLAKGVLRSVPPPPPPPAAGEARFSELPPEFRLQIYLDTVHTIAARGLERIEATLAEMSSPPSPQIERGTKRNPIRLSPAGKFQLLLDAADN